MVVLLIMLGLILQLLFMLMTMSVLLSVNGRDYYNNEKENEKLFFQMLFWPVTWAQLLFKICKELFKGFLSIIGDW